MNKRGCHMRIPRIALAFWLCIVGAYGAAFQNLNFESASLVPIPNDTYNRVSFDQAFPGWNGYLGDIQENRVLTNAIFLCCSGISLWSDGRPLIEGTYAVLLHAERRLDGDMLPADATITQTGLVPSEAQSLLFRAQTFYPFSVSLGGEPLSLLPVAVGGNYTVFGADITAWAGQESELRFTVPTDGNLMTENVLLLDSIEFSTTPIPEPSTFALFAVAAAFGWVYWRRKQR